MDMKKYSRLCLERGIKFFDDHGCCEWCSNDIQDKCNCDELEKIQNKTLEECKAKG